MTAAAGTFVLVYMHYSASLPLVASSWYMPIILGLYIHGPFKQLLIPIIPLGR